MSDCGKSAAIMAGMKASLLTLDEVLGALSAVGGRVLCGDTGKFCFTSVETDSRNVVPGTLFVPLVGEFRDGHAFVAQALEKGASVVFVSRDDGDVIAAAEKYPGAVLIHCGNTMRALQLAAGAYVGKFPALLRCSVTGSSGKTTTKELCASILSQKYKVVANPGNFNSETGLPLSVFRIRGGDELGLFEMGMNRVDEIGEIASVFRPNYAVITNIGTAHIGILGSRENIAREKRKIFSYMGDDGVAVIPAADDFADFLAEGVRGKVVRYGLGVNPRIALVADEGLSGTVFSVDGVEMRLALPGRYNFLDALGAVSLALELGLTAEQIKKGIEAVGVLGGRSEIVRGRFTVLKDCYNANPDSMEKAVELCSSVEFDGRKIFVLGDMLELGAESEAAHRALGRLVSESGADAAVFVGDESGFSYEECAASGRVPCVFVRGRDEKSISAAAEALLSFAADGDFVLLKGSRGIGLERILPLVGM